MVWLAGAGHFLAFPLICDSVKQPGTTHSCRVGALPVSMPLASPLPTLPLHTHVSTRPLCSLSQPCQMISVLDTRVFCSFSLFHSSLCPCGGFPPFLYADTFISASVFCFLLSPFLFLSALVTASSSRQPLHLYPTPAEPCPPRCTPSPLSGSL